MPSGDPILHSMFCDMDKEYGAGDLIAWDILESQGWTEIRFVIHPPRDRKKSEISDMEWNAVEYLCDEWDWAFIGMKEVV